MEKGKLVFFCGKMGAGKSTRSKIMAEQLNAVLLCEDELLASLYPDTIESVEDYVKYSTLLKPQIKAIAQSVLTAGANVVMDFPGNTVSQRKWLKSIFSEVDAPHELIYLDVPDHICLSRIASRREKQPERAKTDTREIFEQITKYFEAPGSAEGFHVIEYTQDF